MGPSESGKRPMLATGKIVEDYRPLLAYGSLAKAAGKPPESFSFVPEDFELVKRMAERGAKLSEIIEALAQRFLARLDCSLAERAYEEAAGLRLSKDLACDMMARSYAGWLVEASEQLGILKIVEPWKPRGRG